MIEGTLSESREPWVDLVEADGATTVRLRDAEGVFLEVPPTCTEEERSHGHGPFSADGSRGGSPRESEAEAEVATAVAVVSCPAAPPTYGIGRLVTIDAFLGPSAPKWGWPIRVERNDVITLFDGGSLWALTS